jgi:hypothetical protein
MRLTICNLVKLALCAVVSASVGMPLHSVAGAQELNINNGEHSVHIMRTPQKMQELVANLPAAGTPMTYHGGPVMTSANTYAIFWIPAHLQSGAATTLPAHYQSVVESFLQLYPHHGLDNNNTQYYQVTGSSFFRFTNFVQNTGAYVAAYVDTAPYPSSGCTDWYTGSNCLSDSQIQSEIERVMTLNGWTGGINKMYLMYTSSGEGSCSGYSCAYTDYCAYHSYFGSAANPVIYGNMPYADPAYCQVGGTPSPNGDAAGDAAANVTSHELTEAITDPELNGWYAGDLGHEIGDLCAWNYGTNTWDGSKANQYWPESYSNLYLIGHFPIYQFELQQEYDNHVNGCVQVGP